MAGRTQKASARATEKPKTPTSRRCVVSSYLVFPIPFGVMDRFETMQGASTHREHSIGAIFKAIEQVFTDRGSKNDDTTQRARAGWAATATRRSGVFT